MLSCQSFPSTNAFLSVHLIVATLRKSHCILRGSRTFPMIPFEGHSSSHAMFRYFVSASLNALRRSGVYSGSMPRSRMVTSGSRGMPRAAKASVAPASRSMTVITRSTWRPNSTARSIARRDQPPVVVTSSTITTRLPASTGPSMYRCIP